MKKITQNIFIVGLIVAGIFAMTTASYADFVPLNSSNPEPLKFLDISATNQSKQGWLGLGFTPGTYNPFATLDVKNTTFTTALSVLGKGWVSGNMLVGYNSIPAQITNRLMVAQDHIRSSLLAGTGSRPVCSDANGNFVMCSNAQQATPQVVSTSPLCGSAANTFAASTPTTNLCNNSQQLGSVTYQGNGAYSWTCYVFNGTLQTGSCATSPLPPTCGQATYVATTSAPTADRCLSGTPSTVTGGTNGVYTWTCTDTLGNTPVTCTTPANNTTPVKPQNCFAMYGSNYNRAVLTCANGSPTATRYQIQAYDSINEWWTNSDFAVQNAFHSIPATNATPISAAVGPWVATLSQQLPTAIMISQFNVGSTINYIDNHNSGAAYVWRIRGCNGTSNCGPYSDPIYPGPFYNEFWQTQFGQQYQPNFTMTVELGGKLKFSWEQPPNEPTAGSLYSTLYIRKCNNEGCFAPGGGLGVGFQLESVDPATLAGSSDLISFGPISCSSGGICSVITTNPENPSIDYMLTLGKDLYNDAFPGPTSTAANQNLTGYLSAWDQFSPWYAIDN